MEFVQESGCPYGSWLVPWGVMLDNQVAVQPSNATLPTSSNGARLTGDSNYSTIWFSLPNGTYSYTILPDDPLGSHQSGNITVDGSNLMIQVYAFITEIGCSSTVATTSTSSTYCVQTGIHGTLFVRVVADETNQPITGANVTATITNYCSPDYQDTMGLTNSTGYSAPLGWTGNFVVSVDYAGTYYTFPAQTSGAVSLATLSLPSGVVVEKTIACGGLGCNNETTTVTASSSSVA